jgi:hypothetical protein
MIPSREIPFFGEAPKWFWAIIAKFGCIRVSSGDPNLAIWFFLVSFRLSGKLANVAQNRIQYIRTLVNPFVDPFVTTCSHVVIPVTL